MRHHAPAPSGGEAAAPFDMEAPAPAEAGLLEAPVQALEDRLQQLLADWPEHPILSQLAALCQRLTGALPNMVSCRAMTPCKLPAGCREEFCSCTWEGIRGSSSSVLFFLYLAAIFGNELGALQLLGWV